MLSTQQTTFRDRIVSMARTIAPHYALDWRLMAATAILESGWGDSVLARQAHNLFGITAPKPAQDERVFWLHSPSGKRPFRKFTNEEEACHAYGKLVGRSSLYAKARNAALDACIAQLAPVYCPDDPLYGLKITQIIEMIDTPAPRPTS
jgi:flagellum-specific peptidoglycan hydrolase FlgJ